MSDNTIVVGGVRFAARPQTLELMTSTAALEVEVTRVSARLDRIDTEIAAKSSRLREMADEGVIDEEVLSSIETDLVTLDERRQSTTREHLQARIALVAARLDGHTADDLIASLDLRDLPELENQLGSRPTS